MESQQGYQLLVSYVSGGFDFSLLVEDRNIFLSETKSQFLKSM